MRLRCTFQPGLCSARDISKKAKSSRVTLLSQPTFESEDCPVLQVVAHFGVGQKINATRFLDFDVLQQQQLFCLSLREESWSRLASHATKTNSSEQQQNKMLAHQGQGTLDLFVALRTFSAPKQHRINKKCRAPPSPEKFISVFGTRTRRSQAR